AYDAARQVADTLAKYPRAGYFAVLGMSAAAETCLAIWEVEGASGRGSEAATQVRQVCRNMERYARVNPPARARALLWRGCAEWLDKKTDAARATWQRCLAESERFALPYEAARAHYEMGRRLGVADPERTTHLSSAEDGFRRIGAEPDLTRLAAG